MCSCRFTGNGNASSCGSAFGVLMIAWMKLGRRVDGDGWRIRAL